MTYTCTRGHEVESARRLDTCPAYVRGAPCTGTLHAIGEGARAENARLAAVELAERQGAML